VGGVDTCRRLWLLEEEDPATHQQKWWQYKVEDRGNKEIAEQTCAQVQGFGHSMWIIDPVRADFFMMQMLMAHNEFLHHKLEKKGLNPTGGDARMTPCLFALNTVNEQFTADLMLDLDMAVL
jgi:hypothetical protein